MQGRENIKGALVKPVMVNTRDGQIAIIVTYVSRSRHVSYLKTSLFVAKIHDDLLLFPVEYELNSFHLVWVACLGSGFQCSASKYWSRNISKPSRISEKNEGLVKFSLRSKRSSPKRFSANWPRESWGKRLREPPIFEKRLPFLTRAD